MVNTKKHEALFHLVESSKQTVTEKEKQKVTCHGRLGAYGLETDGIPAFSYEYDRNGWFPLCVGSERAVVWPSILNHSKSFLVHMYFKRYLSIDDKLD